MFFFIKVKKNLRQSDCKLSKMLLMNLTEDEILARVSLLIDTGFVRFLCQIVIEKGPFVEWLSDCNWNGKLTQNSWKQGWLKVLISKKHSTHENTRSLQVASWNNDGTIQIYGCKCSFEITICLKQKYLSHTLYIIHSWLQMLF